MRQDPEAGQALVEFALILPVLVMLLGGIAYCGSLALMQENLAVAARNAARQAAMVTTVNGLRAPLPVPPAGGGVYQSALRASGMDKGVQIASVNWGHLGANRIDDHTGILEKRHSRSINGFTYHFGIGVAFYGVTANRDLASLRGLGKLAGVLTPRVSATAVMPAELPPRGAGGLPGVLDENSWIHDIVTKD